MAVRHDGRANPNQLLLTEGTLAEIADLRELLLAAHQEQFGRTDDLLIGLQLTYSGRFARPNDKRRLEPRVVYRHPYLDSRFGVRDNAALLSDDEIARLTDDFVYAGRLAWEAGFAFVDIKHCHGYLGHEFLSAVDRPGRYGGSLENRTRFLRDIVAGIRAEAPGLDIGVRVSVFDLLPFQPGPDGIGVPAAAPASYPYAFGGDGTGLGIDLAEPSAFLDLLAQCGIELVCTTAGSPYYNPHVQRPAAFPPSDGYQPPEDPLVGVARQIAATARLKALASAAADRGFRLLVFAGVVAARGPARAARRGSGFHRFGTAGAVLSRIAGRRAGGSAAEPQTDLPHLQRLHDRSPQRLGLGLLPARQVLQRPAQRRRSWRRSNGEPKGVQPPGDAT